MGTFHYLVTVPSTWEGERGKDIPAVAAPSAGPYSGCECTFPRITYCGSSDVAVPR